MRNTQPKFQEIWETFCNFGIFGLKNRFSCLMRRATWRALLLETSFGGKLRIFGFLRKKYECPQMARKFCQVLSFQKGQNTSKTPFLPLFGHTGSNVGRTHFWRGKWTPNLEIPPFLESRQIYLSSKPAWS